MFTYKCVLLEKRRGKHLARFLTVLTLGTSYADKKLCIFCGKKHPTVYLTEVALPEDRKNYYRACEKCLKRRGMKNKGDKGNFEIKEEWIRIPGQEIYPRKK